MHREDLDARLEKLGLTQQLLAKLQGKNGSTVNRWKTNREDARPLPQYVAVFLDAFEMLNAEQRQVLIAKYA